MSTPRENKDQYVRRMATAICSQGGRHLPSDGPCSECVNVAYRAYDAGARIPDPPPAPTVVVSEEAQNRYHDVHAAQYREIGGKRSVNAALAAAFPYLLASNQWAIDAAIRERVAKLPTSTCYPPAGLGMPKVRVPRSDNGNAFYVDRADLLTALGVAP